MKLGERRKEVAVAAKWSLAGFRRVAILALTAPLALAACDSDQKKAAQTAPPLELRAPEGFSAEPDGFSVVLTWSEPSDSAEISGYEVRRDGQFLESFSSAEVTFTDFDVKPGRSYSYEIRSKGRSEFSGPVSTEATIKIPPLKAARLAGDFGINTRVVSSSGYSTFKPTSLGWRFRPKCGEGPCDVVWRDVSDKRVHAVLKKRGGRYTGDYKGVFFIKCQGSRSISSVHVDFKVTKARVAAGEWRATRIEGTLKNSEAPQFGCLGATGVQHIKGKLRL
jgi:hypothetical protein